ncbi:MAG: hypothetical protein K2G88_09520 [Oscillospiraceae bacterium]|nr:hypothetical protein [Oscillospiraceae bacterium]
MPETWKTAFDAVTSGVTDAMSTVTGNALLLALTFGFIFLRKAIGVVKKLIRLGGTN